MRGNPNRFLVCRLNHSAKAAWCCAIQVAYINLTLVIICVPSGFLSFIICFLLPFFFLNCIQLCNLWHMYHWCAFFLVRRMKIFLYNNLYYINKIKFSVSIVLCVRNFCACFLFMCIKGFS